MKNLLKSFRALHRPNQGGDGGVVQLQSLKQSRLHTNESQQSTNQTFRINGDNREIRYIHKIHFLIRTTWIDSVDNRHQLIKSSRPTSRMVVSTSLGSPSASPSESPNKLVILPLCLSKNPPAWVSHDKQELTESNITENN